MFNLGFVIFILKLGFFTLNLLDFVIELAQFALENQFIKLVFR